MALGLTILALAAGCASTPQVAPPEKMDEMTPPEILYQAIISTYEQRDLPIELASEKFMLVTSEYDKLSPILRRRMAARVVRAPRGAVGLKVTAEFQRRTRIDGRQVWTEVDTVELRKRAKSDELALARAIETRFERWKEQWKDSQDSQASK